MPTIYTIRELTSEESEVKAAIAALAACDTPPTQESIQQFTKLPKTKVSAAVKRLVTIGHLQKQTTR